MNIFGLNISTKKGVKREINEQLKSAFMDAEVTGQNEAYQALYSMIMSGMPLGKDSKLKDYVKQGYESNPDLFSIVTKLAGMFASVPLIPYKHIGSKLERTEMTPELNDLFTQINYYQNFHEFRRHWAVSYYITGNAITYAGRLNNGINKGKLTKDGLIVMPAQNITIKSGGWRKPVGKYVLDINERFDIDAKNIWHERFAPTLSYEEGKNFMGTSPLSVARNIINSQNKGYEVTGEIYKHGHPPGILAKEVEDGDSGSLTQEQEDKFRRKYRTKYQGSDKMTIPIFTLGKLNYTKIGYDNLKELEVINMSEHGRRVFCNLLGVDAKVFNDTAASTYNNMPEAHKAIYNNRLIPDLNTFCEGINSIMQYYGIQLQPDLDQVDALQVDKAKKVEWASKMYNDGVITGDQYLVMIGEEPTGEPDMQVRYMNMNRVPVNFDSDMIDTPDESDKYYNLMKLPNAM